MMKTNLILVKNLTKHYKNLDVLNNLNLKIYQGDRIALLGVNGSGKTTLMEIILKLQNPSSGNVTYFHDIEKKWHATFQEGKYMKKLKVETLIEFYKMYFPNSKQDLYVKKLLELFELKNILKTEVNKLSFGQRKKLELVLALISNSEFYFFDEITVGIDINAKTNLLKFFKKYFKDNFKKTMVWITHEVREIETLCNRIIILSKNKKKIIFDGNLIEAKQKFKSIDLMVESYLLKETSDKDKILKDF